MPRKKRGLGEVVHTAKALRDHVKQECRIPYFDKDTMRFFNSRLSSKVHPSKAQDATYFVTSERHGYADYEPRLYSVRRIKGCTIDTVGTFQQYQTSAQAHGAAKRFAKQAKAPTGLSGSRRKKRRR